MTDTEPFALIVVLTAAAVMVAVLSNRLTERVKIPSPALVLAGAAVAVQVIPALRAPPQLAVERVVTVALVCILFDGGMHIGWTRFRSAVAPITIVGVFGTFLTVAAGAVLVHLAFGLAWYVSLLVATAVAPTDPAVVFSVLGQREVSGRSGTILEGESGANDPVGIALMASLITAGGLSAGAFARVGGEFALQMGVGAAVGVLGGRALLWFIRRVPLPSEGLYPLRTLASALLLFGIATLAHGSGFLAVFTAGIVLGDGRAPVQAGDRAVPLGARQPRRDRRVRRPRPHHRPRRDRPPRRVDPRAHPRSRARVLDPASPGRVVPDPRPAQAQRAQLRAVRRA